MSEPRFPIERLRPWIEVRYSRAAGPGGQNVNKLNTRAELYFDFIAADLFTTMQRERIARHCAARLAEDGRLRIVAQDTRSQSANRELAETRLVELLTRVLHVHRPRTATQPTRAARRRRVADKKHRGQTKQQRRRQGPED